MVRARKKKGDQVSSSSEQIAGFLRTTIYTIEVRTAADILLAPAEVKEILRDAGELVRGSDGQGDVECSVDFVLGNNGVIDKFDSPQIITNRHDLNDLNDNYKGVKVVKEIWWCNGFWPGILGCQKDKGVVFVLDVSSSNNCNGGT